MDGSLPSLLDVHGPKRLVSSKERNIGGFDSYTTGYSDYEGDRILSSSVSDIGGTG